MDNEPLTQIKTLDQYEEAFREWNDQHKKDLKTQLNLYHDSMIKFKDTQNKVVTKIESGKKMLSIFKLKLKSLCQCRNNLSTSNDDIFDNVIECQIKNLKSSLKETNDLQNSVDLILPKYPSWFLRQCIGDVNISLYWKKFNYKERYESFKLKSSLIFLILWILNWIFIKIRLVDSILHGYAIWYYSSLTIQEGILVANGSHIKCWWRAHHFLAVLATGLMLLWPPNSTYDSIRNIHYIFGCIQCIIQMIQYRYQKAQLYRIRSLGTTMNMDITNEGVTKQLVIGLSVMSFFLFIHYCFQFYLAFRIYTIYIVHGGWQLFIVICLYTIFGVGNLITLLSVIYSKIKYKFKIRPDVDLHRALDISLSDYYKMSKIPM